MTKIKRLLDNIEQYMCIVIMVAILAILTYQVFTRYVLKYTPEWAEELARYLFIWLIFIGASYAAKQMAHIRIETLTKLWPLSMRKYVMGLGAIVWLGFNITIFVVSAIYTKNVFVSKQIAIGAKINMGWAYLAIPLGYGLISIRVLANLITGKELIVTNYEDPGVPPLETKDGE